MSYQAIHYNAVFEAFRSQWGDAWCASVNSAQWNVWRAQLKRLFDEGILIKDIIAALPEASEPRKWPGRTALMHRVRDVVLKNRIEEQQTVRVNEGVTPMAALLAARMTRVGQSPSEGRRP